MSQGMQFKRRSLNEQKENIKKLQAEVDIDDAKRGERINLSGFSTKPPNQNDMITKWITIEKGERIDFNEIPLLVKFLKAVAGKHGVKVE